MKLNYWNSIGIARLKLKEMVMISCFNPINFWPDQLLLQLKTCIDKQVNIQYYNKINQHVTKYWHKIVWRIYRRAKYTWENSHLPIKSNYKPGDTDIVIFGSMEGRIMKSGFDLFGRWTHQVFNTINKNHSLIFSIYNCCKNPCKNSINTAYYQ